MPEGLVGIEEARRNYLLRDWRAAIEGFEAAQRSAPLSPDDLAAWGRAAWWLGRAAEGIAFAERAFAGFRDAGRVDEAAETALRIALLRAVGTELTVGLAWMRRAEALLEGRPAGPLHAYLAYLAYFGASVWRIEGVAPAPDEPAERLRDFAQRVPDRSVATLERFVSGLDDVRAGHVARGFALLDEAMLGVLSGDVEAEWGGDMFCSTMHACYELADHRRMADWTRATEEWCRRFGSDAIYSGVCRVHRLELRSAAGDWDGVEGALTEVCGRLASADPWVAGAGWYQIGELRRMRGDAAGAQEAYALARERGYDPLPGEALLELEEGEPVRAWHLLTTALGTRERVSRPRLLRAGVEVALATGRTDAARAFCRELRDIADDFDSAGFRAWADHADGMLELADGDGVAALGSFQAALAYFRRHGLRCEHARMVAWLAAAFERTGDAPQAQHLRAEAAAMFERIGARADVEVVRHAGDAGGPLTPREREVLEQAAQGASNREIAERLVISEKTVERHLANIYPKLAVGSRTAAAAWWHEHARSGG